MFYEGLSRNTYCPEYDEEDETQLETECCVRKNNKLNSKQHRVRFLTQIIFRPPKTNE